MEGGVTTKEISVALARTKQELDTITRWRMNHRRPGSRATAEEIEANAIAAQELRAQLRTYREALTTGTTP